MKVITMYKCDYCNEIYSDFNEAALCEERGKAIPLAKVGDLVDYEVTVGGGFDSFYVEHRIGKVEDKGHYFVYHLEQYDEEDNEWYESNYNSIGIWGNGEFNQRCKLKN